MLKIRRGNYNKKKFNQLFEDLSSMKEEFHRPYRFKKFSLHVFTYDQMCKPEKFNTSEVSK